MTQPDNEVIYVWRYRILITSGKWQRLLVFAVSVLMVSGMLPFGPQASSGRDSVRLPAPSVPAERGLSEGKFLVASRKVKDPRFSETVILLVQYGFHGAVGLIINRPTEVKLSTIWPDIAGLKDRNETLFIGGPMGMKQMMLLIQSGRRPADAHDVFNDVYASTSMTTLRQLTDDPVKGERFKAYTGYSGWAAGQLDREISRGDWHVMDADARTIFEKDPSEVWQELIRRLSGDWIITEIHDPYRYRLLGSSASEH
jgi:putative transcriptional regulator